jgi:hypothetical protein
MPRTTRKSPGSVAPHTLFLVDELFVILYYPNNFLELSIG